MMHGFSATYLNLIAKVEWPKSDAAISTPATHAVSDCQVCATTDYGFYSDLPINSNVVPEMGSGEHPPNKTTLKSGVGPNTTAECPKRLVIAVGRVTWWGDNKRCASMKTDYPCSLLLSCKHNTRGHTSCTVASKYVILQSLY